MRKPLQRPSRPQSNRDYSFIKSWEAGLAQQQAIYEELLAGHELDSEASRSPKSRKQQTASAQDLTRDLAGWTLPQDGVLLLHSRRFNYSY